MNWIRAHKPIVAALALGAIAVAVWLAFGVFGVHLLFVDHQVDEAGPVFDSATSTPTDSPVTTAAAATSAPTSVPTVKTIAMGDFVSRSHPTSGRAALLSDGRQTFVRFEGFETENGPAVFVYLSRGVSAGAPERAFDDDFVDLGELKGNVGDQNYEVPPGVDLSSYSTVVIWCRRFSVAFGAADLA